MTNEIYELYGGYLQGLKKSWNSSPCATFEKRRLDVPVHLISVFSVKSNPIYSKKCVLVLVHLSNLDMFIYAVRRYFFSIPGLYLRIDVPHGNFY